MEEVTTTKTRPPQGSRAALASATATKTPGFSRHPLNRSSHRERWIPQVAFASPIFGTAGEALPRGFFGSLSFWVHASLCSRSLHRDKQSVAAQQNSRGGIRCNTEI
eukprot:symbB.v1.2.013445.t1/scaffold953.1/size150470/2